MASNYQDVIDQLQASGLVIVDGLQVGRLTRCRVEGDREKRGWYSLHELVTTSGDTLIVGSFGIWQGAASNSQKVELRKNEISTEQRDSLRRRMAEDKKRAERERLASAKRAADQAAKTWAKCSPTGDSDYLVRKGVAAHGVRYSPSGALVIPLLNVQGMIQGLQVIRGRDQAKKDGRGEKEFWPAGVAKKGHFHLIGMPSTVVLIAEGYATAASLHEATQLPVAVAWDAGNLAPVAAALRGRYKQAKILICADDDAGGKCRECRHRVWLPDHPETCPHCGEPHQASNTGITLASSAAIEVGGSWLRPTFERETTRRDAYIAKGLKQSDFNDLHMAEGLHQVRTQIEAHLRQLGWNTSNAVAARATDPRGKGEALRPIESLDELLERFALVYGHGGAVFDRHEHEILSLSDMRDACLQRQTHRAWMEHPDRAMVRVREVGFDPTGRDKAVLANLWGGWPTTPQSGTCDKLIELLHYLCSNDADPARLFQWVLRWLAYPIQNHGAKMKTTVVLHGPQGTGKNMFFEAVMAIYGRYGRVIDQSAIEDKFNDWASHKLFLIADEVVARSDVFHIKNKLKAFITGDWVRINTKQLKAHDERNHVNLIFLSNETMPVVLEQDDRRHCVVWTPPELPAEFYTAVKAEMHAGGVEALHDLLLKVDLSGFTDATRPPDTEAKRELISLSRDSTSRFFLAMQSGDIGDVTARPALATDVYALYKIWCKRSGYHIAPMDKLLNALKRKHGVRDLRKRWLHISVVKGPHAVLYLGDQQPEPGGSTEQQWLGDHIADFRKSMDEYRGEGGSRE